MRLAKMVFGLLTLTLMSLTAARAAFGAEPNVRKIVVFRSKISHYDRVAILQAAGSSVFRRLDMINAIVIQDKAGNIHSTEMRLRQHPDVLRVDDSPMVKWLLERPAFPDVSKSIPRFQSSRVAARLVGRNQETPWGISRVNAPTGWGKTQGKGVKVAVIDTGIDQLHPDLKVVGGWNAVDKDKPSAYDDDNGHGTHCAGTVAALDNGKGVVGVAPEVSLYAVKVLNAEGYGTFDDVIAGMQWAVDNKMDVASMSLGADNGNDSLKDAVAAMAKAGVLIVAAAGNSGAEVGYPAAYPEALAVAAMDEADTVAWFSSRGSAVALIAPGVDVKSTYKGGEYDTLSGTSMATPHVSGLAALAIANGAHGPKAVRAALIEAATALKDANGSPFPVEEQGAGVPDAGKLEE